MIAAQLFTLVGVALGATASYLFSSLNERERHRREVAKGWEGRKYDNFVAFVEDIKTMAHYCRRMAAALNLEERAVAGDKLEVVEGSPLLAEANQRRAISLERLGLLSDVGTIAAAYQLNEAIWVLEWIVEGQIPGAGQEHWERAVARFMDAFDAFHRCARLELGVPGGHVPRQIPLLPSLDALGN
jgi:hypothetical protein